MTDKEFDTILKDALTASEVPSELNEKLLNRITKRKSSKILTFIKSASAVAAVFICGVAILSYYNSDAPLPKENITQSVETHTTDEKENDVSAASGSMEVGEEVSPAPASEEKLKPVQKKSTQPLAQADLASADVSADIASPESAEDAQALPQTFSKAKIAEAALSSIFNEGYDYKSLINERISLQISELPNSSDYTFEGISGNEAFMLNEENLLTITFPAGKIAAEEHGEQFFTVGTVTNGILE